MLGSTLLGSPRSIALLTQLLPFKLMALLCWVLVIGMPCCCANTGIYLLVRAQKQPATVIAYVAAAVASSRVDCSGTTPVDELNNQLDVV